MITNIRNSLNSLLVKILLGVLILAFAVVGVPAILTGSTTIVASVGDEDISTQKFVDAVQNQVQLYQMTYKLRQSSNEIIRTFRLDQQVLGQLMVEAAYRANARAMGMRMSKESIAKEMRTIDAFKMGGVFSQTAVQEYLRNAQISYQDFEDEMELNMIRRQLGLTLFSFQPSATRLSEMLYAYDNERRTATMITITRSDIEDEITITPEEISAAFEKGKEGYMTEERRSYDYILLSPEAFKLTTTVTDEEIQAAYDSKKSVYIVPEKRTLNQITLATEDDAKAFLGKIAGGADFVTTAAEMTDFTAEEIAIGDYSKETMTSNFTAEAADAVFALDTNAVTAPLKSLSGFDVFQVAAITAGQTTALETVKEELADTIKQDKAVREMYKISQQIDDEISTGLSFTEIAEKFNLTVGSVDDVTRYGLDQDNKPLVQTQEGAAVIQKAFDVEEDDYPELFDIAQNDPEKGSFLVAVKKVDMPRQKTLEEMTEDLTTELTQERKTELAAERAEQAMERLQKGEEAQDIVADLGGISFAARRIGRVLENNQSQNAIAQNIRDLLFTLNPGEIDIERTGDNTGYVVIRSDEILPADMAAQREELEKFKTSINDALMNDISQYYVSHLFELYKPTQNDALIQSLFTDDQ